MNDNDKLQSIIDRLIMIEQKIDKLNERIEKCELSCKKMDDHINFVENTYETLRTPLDFMKDKFNYLTGNDGKPLPIMDTKKN